MKEFRILIGNKRQKPFQQTAVFDEKELLSQHTFNKAELESINSMEIGGQMNVGDKSILQRIK
jgi:hypothetical protein